MGMGGREVLLGVELPNALPLIMGGVRSSVLQVISTATIAAYVALGGLGRFLIDGLSLRASADDRRLDPGALLAVARTCCSPACRS